MKHCCFTEGEFYFAHVANNGLGFKLGATRLSEANMAAPNLKGRVLCFYAKEWIRIREKEMKRDGRSRFNLYCVLPMTAISFSKLAHVWGNDLMNTQATFIERVFICNSILRAFNLDYKEDDGAYILVLLLMTMCKDGIIYALVFRRKSGMPDDYFEVTLIYSLPLTFT